MIDMDVHKTLHSNEGPMKLHIRLKLSKGQFGTLYGPSGAGKTSTLKILAGLLQPDTGYVSVNGIPWFDAKKGLQVRPQDRHIGFVFQDYALFPHLSVYKNLSFALPKGADGQIVNRLARMMGLEGLGNRKPAELSGGQQQRVAVARALVQQPQLLLLDEPLAALDLETRLRLQDDLAKLHREFGLTTLLISHDTGEIMKLSDRVFQIREGSIIREGSPQEIFLSKKMSGKFQFTGEILRIERQDVVYIVTVQVQSQVVKVIAGESDIHSLKVGDRVLVASKAFNPILYKI